MQTALQRVCPSLRSSWLVEMWGGLVSRDQVISYIDAMRSNPLITACRDGIFPAIVNEQNTFWNRAVTVPQYWRRFTERIAYGTWLQAINHCMQHHNGCISEWRIPISVFLSNHSRQLWVRSTVTPIPRPRYVGRNFVALWSKKFPKFFFLYVICKKADSSSKINLIQFFSAHKIENVAFISSVVLSYV